MFQFWLVIDVGEAQLTVSSAIPELVVLGNIRKQPEQAKESKSESSTSP